MLHTHTHTQKKHITLTITPIKGTHPIGEKSHLKLNSRNELIGDI